MHSCAGCRSAGSTKGERAGVHGYGHGLDLVDASARVAIAHVPADSFSESELLSRLMSSG